MIILTHKQFSKFTDAIEKVGKKLVETPEVQSMINTAKTGGLRDQIIVGRAIKNAIEEAGQAGLNRLPSYKKNTIKLINRGSRNLKKKTTDFLKEKLEKPVSKNLKDLKDISISDFIKGNY